MATKRQAPAEPTTRSSWKRHKPNHPNNPNNVPRPNHGKNSFKKAHAVNDLKSTIRSLRRLLERKDDLPAGVRIEKERALQTAQRELDTQQRAKQRSEIIGKWHKVRFFERRKAERRLKKARKELGEAQEQEQEEGRGDDGDVVGELRRRVEECGVEVAYAMYFPLQRDYVPLFVKAKKEGDDEGSGDAESKEGERYGDPEMWETIGRCMREGTLQDLREGRLGGEEASNQDQLLVKSGKAEAGKGAKAKGQAKGKEQKVEEESDDEDGGAFFE